jgi:hypothetical protein
MELGDYQDRLGIDYFAKRVNEKSIPSVRPYYFRNEILGPPRGWRKGRNLKCPIQPKEVTRGQTGTVVPS